jgi:hypothetical protein
MVCADSPPLPFILSASRLACCTGIGLMVMRRPKGHE